MHSFFLSFFLVGSTPLIICNGNHDLYDQSVTLYLSVLPFIFYSLTIPHPLSLSLSHTHTHKLTLIKSLPLASLLCRCVRRMFHQ